MINTSDSAASSTELSTTNPLIASLHASLTETHKPLPPYQPRGRDGGHGG